MQRNNGMQLAAALCLMLGVFPIWYWYCSWAAPEGMAFLFTGVSLVLTAVAWLHRRYGFPLERKSLLLAGILARTAAVLLGVGGYALARMSLTQPASVGAGIMLWLVYLTAWELQRLPVEKLFSVHAFILVCVACFVGMLLCWLQGQTEFGDVNFLMLGVTIALFGVLRNRWMLLGATAGRSLPKGFHRHNLGLMVWFLALGTAVFACRKWVAAFVGSILKAVWSMLVKVMQLVSVRYFQPEQPAPTESLPKAATEQQKSVWLGGLINFVVIGLALFLVIRFRSELWDFLRQTAVGMFRLLRKFVLAKAPEFPPETHPEYTDSVELLDTAPVRDRRKKEASWRQYYRNYRHLSDPSEKYRAGYALWMRALKHWHAEVPPNAVPARLLELSSGIPDPALTASVTEVYYKVRYGGHIPTGQELAEMDRLVRTVRKTMQTVRYRVPDEAETR